MLMQKPQTISRLSSAEFTLPLILKISAAAADPTATNPLCTRADLQLSQQDVADIRLSAGSMTENGNHECSWTRGPGNWEVISLSIIVVLWRNIRLR